MHIGVYSWSNPNDTMLYKGVVQEAPMGNNGINNLEERLNIDNVKAGCMNLEGKCDKSIMWLPK